ncbi:MAG: hypothetical protein S4CHLAM2_11310 [Chlamydiales bacterium]|nr:hypothetical protein [Chlamydiales bacterium]
MPSGAISPISPSVLNSPIGLAEWKVRQSPNGTIDPTPPEEVKAQLRNRKIVGDIIYRIKHEGTSKRSCGSVKYTDRGNTLGKRFCHYKYKMNKPDARHTYSENAVRRSPNQFTVKILDHHPGISERQLLEIEEAWQNRFHTRNRRCGYNQSRPTQERLRTLENRENQTPYRPPLARSGLPNKEQESRSSVQVRADRLKLESVRTTLQFDHV